MRFAAAPAVKTCKRLSSLTGKDRSSEAGKGPQRRGAANIATNCPRRHSYVEWESKLCGDDRFDFICTFNPATASLDQDAGRTGNRLLSHHAGALAAHA